VALGPGVGLRLEQLCRGACVPLPSTAQRAGPSGAVVVEHAHGVTETFTPRGGSVEQTFLIRGAPLCQGDLTLDVTVLAREVRPSARGHELVGASGQRLTYGRAFVVRPGGEKIALETERTRTGLRLRVPARLADAADAWPMLIDPEISGVEQQLEPPLTNGGNYYREPLPQITPHLTPGPAAGSYYVVWTDLRQRGRAVIWGAAVSGTALTIDLAGTKLGTELSDGQPAVNSAPMVDVFLGATAQQRGYLVVWESPFTATIWYRRVGLTGVPIDAAPVNLSNPSPGRLPSVACLGARCLVAWLDGSGVVVRELAMQADGTVDAGPVRVSTLPGARWVSLAAMPEQRAIAAAVMVADPNDGGNLAVSYLFDDGGTSVVPVGSGAELETRPAIVQGGDGGTAVAWIFPGAGARVLAVSLTTPFSAAAPTPQLIPTALRPLFPTLAWDGDDFHLAWSELDGTATGAALHHLRFGQGPPTVVNPAPRPGVVEAFPSIGVHRVGANATQTVVAFQQTTGGGAIHDIVLRRLDTQTLATEQDVVASRSASAQVEPAVLPLGNKYLLAWADTRRANFDVPASIAVGELDPTGLVAPSAVADLDSFAADFPSLAPLGAQQLLVWRDHASGVYMQRFNRTAAVDGQRIALSSGPEMLDSQTDPSVASAGTRALVAWTGQGGLWVKRVDANVIDPVPTQLVLPDGGAEFARVAWDGARYVIVWNTRGDPNVLIGGTLTTALVANVGVLDSSPANHVRPALASDGKGHNLIAWSESSGADTWKVVALVREFGAGSMARVIPIAANTAPPSVQRMAAVFDGDRFLLAYRGPFGVDIASISVDGMNVEPSSLVRPGVGRPLGFNPALAVQPDGTGVLLYDQYVGGGTLTTRTFFRTIAVERDGGSPVVPDGGATVADAGFDNDGGVKPPPPLELPASLAATCTQRLEQKFESEARGEWRVVEGPGAIDAEGNYVWVPGRDEGGAHRLRLARGAREGATTITVACPGDGVLRFGSRACGCGASGFTPLALLALLLLRKRRGALPLLGLLGLFGCGRTGFYEARATGAPPPPPPPVSFCGDGTKDPGEACDDGDTDATDECLPDCAPARCGDGYIRTGVEACDDGNTVDTDDCTTRCALTTCGNGRLDPGEPCDDSNLTDTDACLSTCLPARCGDGHVFAGMEACDDGNGSNTDACTVACAAARCGDGFTRSGVEKCDDGNAVDDDFCTNRCELPVCGDGRKAGGEECDLGAMNGDRPAFLISQPSGTSIATDALVRAKTAVAFYDYRSASSHTGLERVGESRIYLYVDSGTGRLSLVLTHGIDRDSSGERQPTSTVSMSITGLPGGVTLDVVDDPGLNPAEATKTGSTAMGRWNFVDNSDGMVLGGLPFPGVWRVTVTPQFTMGITTWGWVKQDSVRIPLRTNEPITIEAFDTKTFCGTDCKVPRCGDGRFQGGEVCDDGNTVGGDGCAADCKSLR